MAKIENKAITEEVFKPKSQKRLRIEGFNGHFKSVHFNDSGESNKPLKPDELEALKACYPGAIIEEIEEESAEG